MYGRKSWVVTGEMLNVLEGLHHREARRITGMTANRRAGGEWDYPSVVGEMKTVGLHPIGVYTRSRKETIAEMVAFCPIYELFTEDDRMPGTSRLVRWWEQDTVNEPEE